jgi:SNF2 family DNA or RNA helicase
MLRISYRDTDRRAILSWDATDSNAPWLGVITRLVFDNCDDAAQEGPTLVTLPWWSFAAVRPRLLEIFQGFRLKLGTEVEVTPAAAELLRRATANAARYIAAAATVSLEPSQLLEKLNEKGFTRPLTEHQLRNVCRLAALPAGATFSVPGAGKTTEALAVFFYNAAPSDMLLVIAPKNAFAAWDEQLAICVPQVNQYFVRLRDGEDRIRRLLETAPRFMLITYQQLVRVKALIAEHLAQNIVHVYLDESHRIKSGVDRQTPQAVLNLSHLPTRKLILSGTPMPQSIEDMLPQFTFLYPEILAESSTVVDLMRPIYVRTNKHELGLPPVDRVLAELPMAPVQAELYRLMKYEVAREAATALKASTRIAFRSLGRSVAKLLQFVSNPALLSNDIAFAQPDLLRAVLAEGDGPKIRYVLKRTRELARGGHKVLIWTSFVRNVEYLASRLEDLGALYIHGGVDAGDEDDDETREGKIRLFHDNTDVMVLVANPAAAAEGISLHTVCHHAIYLDRTFNAAHYLQSEDRIHRLGLRPDQTTTIEIVECKATIDETVRYRLGDKVSAMADALNDSSLRIDPIPLDPPSIDDPDDYAVGLGVADIEALIHDIGKGPKK